VYERERGKSREKVYLESVKETGRGRENERIKYIERERLK